MHGKCKNCGSDESLHDFDDRYLDKPADFAVIRTSLGTIRISRVLYFFGFIKKARLLKCYSCNEKFSICPHCSFTNDYLHFKSIKCASCKKRYYNFV